MIWEKIRECEKKYSFWTINNARILERRKDSPFKIPSFSQWVHPQYPCSSSSYNNPITASPAFNPELVFSSPLCNREEVWPTLVPNFTWVPSVQISCHPWTMGQMDINIHGLTLETHSSNGPLNSMRNRWIDLRFKWEGNRMSWMNSLGSWGRNHRELRMDHGLLKLISKELKILSMQTTTGKGIMTINLVQL